MGWWILAGLAALVCLVLFAPVRLAVSCHQEELKVWVRVLWVFSIPLLPAPEKDRKEKKPKAKKEKSPKADKEPPPGRKKGPVGTLLEVMGLVLDLLPHLGAAGGYILRRLTLRRCQVALVIGQGDAGDTAIAVGRAYAAAHNCYAPLASLIRVREFRFRAWPDYSGEKVQRLAADAEVSLRPSTLLAGGMLFLIRGAKVLPGLVRRPKGKAKARAARRPA